MFRIFHPDFIVDSVTEFDAARLQSMNVRGLLLDVDGALKPHYGTEILPEVALWIHTLRDAGMKLAFFSNGLAERIAPLAASVGVQVFANCCKPLPFQCRRAVAEMGLTPTQTLIIGDQLFTDVLCGRLVGTQTAYVRPMSVDEPIYTSIKRPLERLVLGRNFHPAR
jgi:HAD superfamily phosphatase (TIGR01668 family)